MTFAFEPIGFVRGGGQYAYEAPRQGILAVNSGVIELQAHCNFETALADLQGFERIWVIFVFDRVTGWRPKVCPPINLERRKIGVLATRSPHRPNPIGISAVRLLKVEGRRLHIAEFDLLDGTPVLDIKPYIPEADSFPEAAIGWRAQAQSVSREIVWGEGVLADIGWLRAAGTVDLENVCRTQLATLALDDKRQRLTRRESGEWVLACRTWRIVFDLAATPESGGQERVHVLKVESGYSAQELLPDTPDPYLDKDVHRKFQRFNSLL